MFTLTESNSTASFKWEKNQLERKALSETGERGRTYKTAKQLRNCQSFQIHRLIRSYAHNF